MSSFKSRKCRIIVIVLIISTIFRLSNGDIGTASRYRPPYIPTNCNGNDASQFPTSNLFGAAGDGVWDAGASCGRQYLVRCISAAQIGTCVPDKTIQIKIVDYGMKLPSAPAVGGTTFVLSDTAFAAIANSSATLINIEFQQSTQILPSPYSSYNPIKQISHFPISIPKTHYYKQISTTHQQLFATLNRTPKGFGPSSRKPRKIKKPETEDDEEEDDDDEEDDEGGVIPEIVTNRMIKRMGVSVGVPLFTGLLFFPLFYYLKVGLKIDVPTWVPVIASFVFFGTALLGVSYGIVSSSWDPLRDGSLLGLNEAKKNWPVFWQSFWGSKPRK